MIGGIRAQRVEFGLQLVDAQSQLFALFARSGQHLQGKGGYGEGTGDTGGWMDEG